MIVVHTQICVHQVLNKCVKNKKILIQENQIEIHCKYTGQGRIQEYSIGKGRGGGGGGGKVCYCNFFSAGPSEPRVLHISKKSKSGQRGD